MIAIPLQPEKKLDDDFEERLFRSREEREAASSRSAADAPAARSTETVGVSSTPLNAAAFEARP